MPRLGILLTLLALVLPASAVAATPKANTGKAGAPCAGSYLPALPGIDHAGLDTTSLGPGAPAMYEIGKPKSYPESVQPVARVMMFMHAGAWFTVGQGALDGDHETAETWRNAGWETVNIDYRPCGQSVADALTFYDLVRAKVGPNVPICIQGESAGAMLALMTASRRPDVACVLAYGAPTDLARLHTQGAREVEQHKAMEKALKTNSRLVHGYAISAFGKKNLKKYSAVNQAKKIKARVLLATGVNDNTIPFTQAMEMAGALLKANPQATADVVHLAAGNLPWVHGSISDAGAQDLQSHVTPLVAPFGKPPTNTPTQPPAGLLSVLGGLLGGSARR